MEDASPNVESAVYTVEKIVDHARFDDMYFRKLMFLKSRHPATDQVMGNFAGHFEKGDSFSKFVYRTRWEGYCPEDDTWEPENNFIINEKGKTSTNECLVAYKKLHNIKGYQSLKAKFTSQALLETLENFGLPEKVYAELKNRFEEWVQEVSKIGTLNEPDLNANAVLMTQLSSQLSEDKNTEAVDNLGMNFDEPETSAAGRLRELQAKKETSGLKRAREEVRIDPLTSSTEKQKAGKQSKKAEKVKLLTSDRSDRDATQPSCYWERSAQERYYEIKARQTKENESSWRKSCALTDSSSSDEEPPQKRKSLDNMSQKLKSELASSSSNGKGGDGKLADATIYVGAHPTTRPNERKENQKKVDRMAKTNDKDVGLMGEMETGPSIGVQQKKIGLTSKTPISYPSQKIPIKLNFDIDPLEKILGKIQETGPSIGVQQKKIGLASKTPTSYPPQKTPIPIKPNFDINPLEKILTGMGAKKNESESKVQNRKSPASNIPQNWLQHRRAIFLDDLPQAQFKKQPHVTKKEKVMAERPKAVPASLPKENDTLIVKEKPSMKENVIKKGAQAVHGYFRFLMRPFLAMPYKRRRARSCSGAMTDGGASFEKEFEKEAAQECRWNKFMERGVRNKKPFEVVQSKVCRSIQMTQICRDGVVRYACAEKGDRQYLKTIGHVISQPVPLREIDMELIEENEKNEVERKKKKAAEK